MAQVPLIREDRKGVPSALLLTFLGLVAFGCIAVEMLSYYRLRSGPTTDGVVTSAGLDAEEVNERGRVVEFMSVEYGFLVGEDVFTGSTKGPKTWTVEPGDLVPVKYDPLDPTKNFAAKDAGGILHPQFGGLLVIGAVGWALLFTGIPDLWKWVLVWHLRRLDDAKRHLDRVQPQADNGLDERDQVKAT